MNERGSPPSRSSSSQLAWHTWLPWLLLAIAVIATAVVYWPGVTGGWVFDDYPNIVDNAAIHITPANSTLVAWVNSALSSPSSFLHRPLASLTFSVNWFFGEGNPWPFKVTNIVIHVLNGVLLYFMLRALLRLMGLRNGGLLPSPSGRGCPEGAGEGSDPRKIEPRASVGPSPPTPLPKGEGSKAAAARHPLPEGEGSTPTIDESTATRLALIVSAAWMLLPINLMAVLYVVQRMESLCQVFVLAGLWAYVHGRWMMLTASDSRRDRHGFALAASGIVLGTLLGLTSKETAVLLPVFAFLAECILLRFATTNLASSRIDSPRPWRSLGDPPSAFAFAGLQTQPGAASGIEEPLSPRERGRGEGTDLPPSPSGRGAGGEGTTLARGSSLHGTEPSPGATRSHSARVRFAPPLPEGEVTRPNSQVVIPRLPEGQNRESMLSGPAESNSRIPDSARDETAGGSGMTKKGEATGGVEISASAPPPPEREGKTKQDSRIWWLFTVTLFIPGVLGFLWLLRGALSPASWSGRDFTLGQRLLTECRVLVDYLHWTLLPNPMVLSLYHDEIVKSTGILTPWTTLGSIVLLAVLIAIAVLLRNRRPLVSLGIGWFFTAQLLTATIIPLELVYEQRMYFASIGVLLAVGALLMGLRWKIALPILRGFVVGIALLWFALATNLRAQEWSNPLRLAIAEADRHPESPRAVYEAGRLLLIASNYQTGKALDESRKYLAKAAAIPGSSSLADQALIMIADHHHQGADADYWNSMIQKLRDQPTRQEDISALISLTNCYGSGICKFDVSWLQRAYAAALSRPHPIARLDGAYADFERDLMHNDPLATKYLARAVAGDPSEPAYRIDLSALYARQGETEKALEQIDALRRMNFAGRLDKQIAVLERLAEQGKIAAPSAK